MSACSPLERALINGYQGGFPLEERPFALIAERLASDESRVISTIAGMLQDRRLSRFGPLYNAERLGGELVLAAMRVAEGDFATVTEQVNAFPEVAHNYRRDHPFNMWFVLATDSAEAMSNVIERIQMETGHKVYPFPKEREFYLGLWFELNDQGGRTRSIPAQPLDDPAPPDEIDRRIIQATQRGLPLATDPFQRVAEAVDCTAEEVRDRFDAMLRRGAIRRIGLVPNHYKLGFRGNGMTVWDIPDANLEAIGQRMAALDYVSHCYARPRHLPEWPYNLFAMVHGHDREEVKKQVAEMRRLFDGAFDAQETLFSSEVLKKTGMRLPI